MTTDDFIFILVEAYAHQDPVEFFKSRQKLWHKNERYSREGFNEGLIKTFKWLNHQVHLPDRHLCQLKLPDGQITDEFVSNEEQAQELRKKGELSFTFQNFILVCRSSDKKAILVLNSQSLEDMWVHLFNYLNPYCKEFLPPLPKLEDENLNIEVPVETILVPETIYRHFRPMDGDDPDADEERMLALPETTQLPPLLPFSLPADRKFTIREAAIILVYCGVLITRDNSNEYARCFGHSSGEKIYQDYSHFSKVENRRRMLDTKIKSRNKIKNFEGILPYLPENYKKTAERDVEIMKKNFSTHFDDGE